MGHFLQRGRAQARTEGAWRLYPKHCVELCRYHISYRAYISIFFFFGDKLTDV